MVGSHLDGDVGVISVFYARQSSVGNDGKILSSLAAELSRLRRFG